jgi:regulator of cell morphogenesis and NO signaling
MIDPSTTVAELVLRHSGCATVFDRREIDYCCQGHQALARACADRALDVAELVAELELVMAETDPEADPRTAPTSALISRALARQHRHLRATLSLLDLQAGELVRDHGASVPTLRMLATSISAIARDMLAHLDHEEDVLFPALLKGDPPDAIRLELGHMFDEHREFADLFRRMRAATNGYRAPEGANANVARLYRGVAELEALVLRHHHLENHVLLPRFR